MELRSEHLFGTWLLQRWQIEYADGRPVNYPFGADAIGVLIYAGDGWMSATMSLKRRSALSAASAIQADLSSRAQALLEMRSYQGRWRLEGSIVYHDIVTSMNPILIGACQRREALLRDDALHLIAREADGAGRQRVHGIIWVRETVPLNPVNE